MTARISIFRLLCSSLVAISSVNGGVPLSVDFAANTNDENAATSTATTANPGQGETRKMLRGNIVQPTKSKSTAFRVPEEKRFKITLVNMGNNTELDDVVRRAAARWEYVVEGDLPDEKGNEDIDWFKGKFDVPYTEDVDDVVIGYEFKVMDGLGKRLGKAGPLHFRGNKFDGPYATISGRMVFDIDDMFAHDAEDQEAIMVHEIGHILGIGPRNRSMCALACRPSTTRGGTAIYPQYNPTKCPNAGQQAMAMGLLTRSDYMTMETVGPRGAACVHLKDLTIGKAWSDVMTARFDRRKDQLITRMDLGALMDLRGYTGILLENADRPGRSRRWMESSDLFGDDNESSDHEGKHSSFNLYHAVDDDDDDDDDYIFIEDIND